VLSSFLSSSLVRLAALLAILAALVRLRLKIGKVLGVAPFIAAALFWTPELPARFAEVVRRDGYEFLFETGSLVALIALIEILGRALKETESLPRLMRSLQELFRDGRVALAGTPAVIGLLPMPGGAMISAPMVEEMSRQATEPPSSEQKTLVNYWFRHLWEYMLPVYPGIATAATIWRVDLGWLVWRQLFLTFAALAAGLVFVLGPVRPITFVDSNPARSTLRGNLLAVAAGLAPVAAIFVVWYGLRLLGAEGLELVVWRPWKGKISLLVAIAVVIIGVVLYHRLGSSWLARQLRTCMAPDMALLLVGAMVFQAVVESSGAVSAMGCELGSLGAPLAAIVVLLPFAAGLLTGMTIAYVTVAFPLLATLVSCGGPPSAGAMVLAFAAGYTGVMLSPVHICLVLTREYFASDLSRVYKGLMGPQLAVMGTALAAWFLWR